jgi:hypothetical protein
MEKMTLEEAKEIVAEYQKWRTSQPPYDGCGVLPPHEPKELTQAIDRLLAAVTVTGETVERFYAALNYYGGFSERFSNEVITKALTAALGGGE